MQVAQQEGNAQPTSSPPIPHTAIIEQAEDSSSMTYSLTKEEDVHFRICEEMSRSRQEFLSPSPQSQNTHCREVMELHEGVNPMTILGQALGQHHPNRFVRFMVEEDISKPELGHSFPGLDAADVAYLEAKAALSFPPRPVCDELLRLYFVCVYPYAPILDRVKVMQDYRAGRHSAFLLQSIFANVVPYAPMKLLMQAGYEDRITAQKAFYAKATLLYDLRCERDQLYMLQGSIMLSSLSFQYAIDKDYRYWLSNAGRIATQMGLHRDYVCENLGKRSRRIFRRIWWVLYNRDTLLAISGIDNLRRFNERYCDTAPLTECDWEEDGEIPDELRDVLGLVSPLQKLFMVEYIKVSIISACFIRDFKTPGKMPSRDEIEQLSNQITNWRKQLPVEIIYALQDEWTSDHILVLVLLAMGYRLEAVFYRAVKEHHRSRKDFASMKRMAQRQENAMFELSTMIQRASMHEVLHLCPLSFMTCASTILAMRIEIALDPAISPQKLVATKAQILSELEYVRESCESWISLIWTLRMFEAVIARTCLSPTGASPTEPSEEDEDSTSINAPASNPNGQYQPAECSSNGFFEEGEEVNFNLPLTDDVFGILPVTENYDWLENLFGRGSDDTTDPLGAI
ncbi:uncharacterized protein A1O5_10435 [Cladophialophora psammophila CBS 110553]|uniref:Xylanolytic transcriptional activator regulatory domain-containing protein n=1 Tax=Cladophialophora psammophila CBS 110553 TaxID=1182543 RepID=W9WE98_9EURO|nr:uncharacterized protein A1O5_10435 [Cladophialophora psammophila CBS 110553]EXJ66283.1 hypothetical protein A1O5_10435 [Cladophialophora psammophila CBS 110553]